MTGPAEPSKQNRNRDAPRWAESVDRLKVMAVPEGAINLNLEGRDIISPLQGFGQMWQKTFRIRLSGVKLTPAQAMQVWKENFPQFQPRDNHFYPPMTGIEPGGVIFIDSKLPVIPGLPGIVPIAAGVMVLYVDDESFTVMTPEGFPVAGWNTFSVFEEDGCLIAQAQSLDRPADPVYEFGFRVMGGGSQQDKIWVHVLESLASHFGITDQQVETKFVCVDPKLQWTYARNIWHNAGIRTTFYVLATPLRWLRDLLRPPARERPRGT